MQVSVLCYIKYMRLHRFYLENIEKQGDLWVTSEEGFIHQLKNVFRAKIGQKVVVFNKLIGEVELMLQSIGKKDMSFSFIRQVRDTISEKNKRQVNIYMSIIKNNNFDLVVEKSVELGVSKIIPIISERTIKNNLNFNRLNKIIIESTEQSGRLDIMKILNPVSLKDLNFSENYKVFGAIDFNDDNFDLCSIKKSDSVDIFIGPEGGFSETEILFLINNGVEGVCINKNILRAETAAIAFATLFS